MIKLNGYWYTREEVETALRRKGYIIITLEVSTHPRDYPLYETYAIKNGEEIGVLNRLESVAINEFEKKPPLI